MAVVPSEAILIETGIPESQNHPGPRGVTFDVSPVAVKVMSELTNELLPNVPVATTDSVNVTVDALAKMAPRSRARDATATCLCVIPDIPPLRNAVELLS